MPTITRGLERPKRGGKAEHARSCAASFGAHRRHSLGETTRKCQGTANLKCPATSQAPARRAHRASWGPNCGYETGDRDGQRVSAIADVRRRILDRRTN